MDDSIDQLARMAGVAPDAVRRELSRAVRRSEADAREVYGVITGRRFVGRKAGDAGDWIVRLEARPSPWTKRSGTKS